MQNNSFASALADNLSPDLLALIRAIPRTSLTTTSPSSSATAPCDLLHGRYSFDGKSWHTLPQNVSASLLWRDLSITPKGQGCSAGSQCVALPSGGGGCMPCPLGSHCPGNTTNPLNLARLNPCPSGRLCATPATVEPCPVGFFYPSLTPRPAQRLQCRVQPSRSSSLGRLARPTQVGWRGSSLRAASALNSET